MHRTLKRLALAGLIVGSALSLAACGVKGPLEPPASAAAETRPAEEAPRVTGQATTVAAPGVGVGHSSNTEDVRRTASSVAATPAATQRSVLDWFIN